MKYLQIKSTLLLLSVFLYCKAISQVTPTAVVENINPSSGSHDYCSFGCLISPTSPIRPVSITGTANVTYRAGSCIQLLPGFSVSSLLPSSSGGGSFKTSIVPPDFPVAVLEPQTFPTTQVGLYEKLELGLDLPADIKNLVNA